MKLIVGLGNIGKKYEKNRHNVGFMVVDRLVEELRAKDYESEKVWKESKKGKLQYLWFNVDEEQLELLKAQTFMNNSGYSVKYAYKKHSLSPSNLFVIHDDLDIPLGEYKIQKGKGPREHKGLLSIYKELGIKDFWHVRIGVDNRAKENRISGEKYVLQDFTAEELAVIDRVIAKIIKDFNSLFTKH